MPAAWTMRGFWRSRRIRKSANDSEAGCSFGRIPLPDSRRSATVTVGSSCATALGEFLDRQPVAFVVVFPILIFHGRPEPDVARRRFRGVDAEAVAGGMGQRVDERIDQRTLRRHQLRVLAADRVDGERLAAQHLRDLVRVQPGRVDDRIARESLPVRCGSRCRPRRKSAPASGVPGRKMTPAASPARRSALTSASASTMPVSGEKMRRDGANVRLPCRDERAVDHLEAFDAVLDASREEGFEPGDLAVLGRDDQLAASCVRDAVGLAELVEKPAGLRCRAAT